MSAITRQEDRQHERKGLIFALLFHGALLLIFFFWIVLKKTNNDGGGTPGELVNFGFSEMGSGDNNSMDPVATQADQTPQEAQPAEAVTDDANLTTTDPAAETVVSETPKPTTTTTVTPTKPTQTTTTTTTTNTNAQPGTTTKPGVATGDGDSKQAGNQGHPDGTLNSKNYYGTPGTGGTGDGSLDMDGWHTETKSKVANPEQESGKVTFIIQIDNQGEILKLTVKEKQVSEALVKKCEDQIRNKMEFVKNDNNGSTAATSTGTITFLFRLN
jgi:hypothetical protein